MDMRFLPYVYIAWIRNIRLISVEYVETPFRGTPSKLQMVHGSLILRRRNRDTILRNANLWADFAYHLLRKPRPWIYISASSSMQSRFF